MLLPDVLLAGEAFEDLSTVAARYLRVRPLR